MDLKENLITIDNSTGDIVDMVKLGNIEPSIAFLFLKNIEKLEKENLEDINKETID